MKILWEKGENLSKLNVFSRERKINFVNSVEVPSMFFICREYFDPVCKTHEKHLQWSLHLDSRTGDFWSYCIIFTMCVLLIDIYIYEEIGFCNT